MVGALGLTILSKCLLTIVLRCWISVCSNIPAPQDGYLPQVHDKLQGVIIGALGPEFLLIVTLGECSLARASARATLIDCEIDIEKLLILKPGLP